MLDAREERQCSALHAGEVSVWVAAHRSKNATCFVAWVHLRELVTNCYEIRGGGSLVPARVTQQISPQQALAGVSFPLSMLGTKIYPHITQPW